MNRKTNKVSKAIKLDKQPNYTKEFNKLCQVLTVFNEELQNFIHPISNNNQLSDHEKKFVLELITEIESTGNEIKTLSRSIEKSINPDLVLEFNEILHVIIDCTKAVIKIVSLSEQCKDLFIRIEILEIKTAPISEAFCKIETLLLNIEIEKFITEKSYSKYKDIISHYKECINSKEHKQRNKSKNDYAQTIDPIPQYFSEIFIEADWRKYIDALTQTNPAILNSEQEFIGNQRKHKGVICSWIIHLQNKSKIKASINRSQLATVLNNEIKNLNLGADGRTFGNHSNLFDDNYKKQLENLTY
jgi:hypothetical protein